MYLLDAHAPHFPAGTRWNRLLDISWYHACAPRAVAWRKTTGTPGYPHLWSHMLRTAGPGRSRRTRGRSNASAVAPLAGLLPPLTTYRYTPHATTPSHPFPKGAPPPPLAGRRVAFGVHCAGPTACLSPTLLHRPACYSPLIHCFSAFSLSVHGGRVAGHLGSCKTPNTLFPMHRADSHLLFSSHRWLSTLATHTTQDCIYGYCVPACFNEM